MTDVPFWKYQGLGNDFIVFDQIRHFVDEAIIRKNVAQLCDRHFGVGADGVLLVKSSQKADCEMVVINADGSEPEMCGNGVRCVAQYVSDYPFIPTESVGSLTVETGANTVLPIRFTRPNTSVVDMGKPIIGSVCQVNGYEGISVSMGNPHLVIFVDDVATIDLEKDGRSINANPLFSKGVNVEFVQIHAQDAIQVRVWERGAGATLACGTGACAAMVAGVQTRGLDRKVTVSLPGGDLLISWDAATHLVEMEGPAQRVFEGRLSLD